MGIIAGVDGSRNRSGGARSHLIGILSEDIHVGIEKVHVWSYKALLDEIPDSNWLVKHNPPLLEKSLFFQIYWQVFSLPREARKNRSNILLNTDAGTVCNFSPAVVMSRDMLSYEPNEMQRYGISLSRLRLLLLKYIQAMSMKRAAGVIFLTKYAALVIQQFTGKIVNAAVIPHGIGVNFKQETHGGEWTVHEKKQIRCLYVSNIDLYKHQEKVVNAIGILKKEGYNLELILAGAKADGRTQEMVDNAIAENDPNGNFISQKGAVKHNEIPFLLREADIFIFASSCENMPNTLIEAMSSGLPIACSDKGPMPEILKNGGVYFNPEQPQSIATALKTIIDDKNLRINIAKRAKELSEHYSWARCANETWEFLVTTFEAYSSK
jgi:glycosyltransferase involved in cell wall biosynthesis